MKDSRSEKIIYQEAIVEDSVTTTITPTHPIKKIRVLVKASKGEV